ncbi:hypothetical protein VM94_04161 [Janthinobacterium sp. KBS0711]|uniref:hypothetical protein n=1 Tax=Janthinobacterium sp. KBS0711 TaxID=1649647 RepID=UPI000635CAF5|nr:hypothetical protein [Janthinobacterium sp. KBS0711]KKO62087.1 hypothetical protein VM94_04161 [Janthinobacterium sp. KBS0711]TSD72078.1 hypothetical protein FFI39_014480 [Janthinobacterium sp. KBS0711]
MSYYRIKSIVLWNQIAARTIRAIIGLAVVWTSTVSAQPFPQTSLQCAVPAELETRIKVENIILMGEVHGTAEAPAAFGTAACRALALGRSVSVGLELYGNEAEVLRSYLASNGGQPASALLLRSSFWTREFQDGRSSYAIFQLIERLRLLAQKNPNLNVFVLEGDAVVNSGTASSTRDEVMATKVRAERARRPAALILTLSGNVHNRIKVMSSSSGGSIPPLSMGVLLADLSPRAVSLRRSEGTFWACAPKCGVHGDPVQEKSLVDHNQMYRRLAEQALYTDEWILGPSTVSSPAIHIAAERLSNEATP